MSYEDELSKLNLRIFSVKTDSSKHLNIEDLDYLLTTLITPESTIQQLHGEADTQLCEQSILIS